MRDGIIGNLPEPRRRVVQRFVVGGAKTAVPGLPGHELGRHGRDGAGLGVWTVAPMQTYMVPKEQWLRCRGGEDQADIEGVEDVDDNEKRGVEDADGTAGIDDVGGVAGVNDVGRDAQGDGRL